MTDPDHFARIVDPPAFSASNKGQAYAGRREIARLKASAIEKSVQDACAAVADDVDGDYTQKIGDRIRALRFTTGAGSNDLPPSQGSQK